MLCIVFSTVMGGCGGTELENKNFPLAVLVEAQDHQYRICYLAQNLSQVSNERSDGDNMTAASATGSTYYETQKAFEITDASWICLIQKWLYFIRIL